MGSAQNTTDNGQTKLAALKAHSKLPWGLSSSKYSELKAGEVYEVDQAYDNLTQDQRDNIPPQDEEPTVLAAASTSDHADETKQDGSPVAGSGDGSHIEGSGAVEDVPESPVEKPKESFVNKIFKKGKKQK